MQKINIPSHLDMVIFSIVTVFVQKQIHRPTHTRSALSHGCYTANFFIAHSFFMQKIANATDKNCMNAKINALSRTVIFAQLRPDILPHKN